MSRSRLKSKGRRPTKPFLMIPRDVLESLEFISLSPMAKCLLLDLLVQYKGKNNGDLCAAWTIMSKRGWKSKATLYKALRELQDKGWIIKTRQGGKHLASLYAITWLPIDECSGKLDIAATVLASNSWRSIPANIVPLKKIRDTGNGPMCYEKCTNTGSQK